MNSYACALLLREGKILLGLRAPHRRAYPNRWDVVGGRVEAGETLEAALTRELGEELGITPTSIEFLSRIEDDNPNGRGVAVYNLFVVRQWSGGEPEMRNNEHSALRWFGLVEACELPGLALAAYRDAFRTIAL